MKSIRRVMVGHYRLGHERVSDASADFVEMRGDTLACAQRAFEHKVPDLSKNQLDFWLWGDAKSSKRVNEGEPQSPATRFLAHSS
jgi:hypothetical protein